MLIALGFVFGMSCSAGKCSFGGAVSTMIGLLAMIGFIVGFLRLMAWLFDL